MRFVVSVAYKEYVCKNIFLMCYDTKKTTYWSNPVASSDSVRSVFLCSLSRVVSRRRTGSIYTTISRAGSAHVLFDINVERFFSHTKYSICVGRRIAFSTRSALGICDFNVGRSLWV